MSARTDSCWDSEARSSRALGPLLHNKKWSQKIEDLFQDDLKLEKVSLNAKNVLRKNYDQQKYYEVLKISKKAHAMLKCRGVTRSDFKFYNNNFYLLEINTQPGMTSLSLVPEIASYKGLSFENLVEKILLDASINR